MINRAIRWATSCALLGSMISASAEQDRQAKKLPTASSNPSSGAELYKQHCAACHGTDLKGNGPFPPPYRMPPDLTKLDRRHGGKFPETYVANLPRLHN